MIKYVEFRSEIEKGGGQRNDVVLLDELSKFIDPLKDCYRSLFYFNESIRQHVDKTGSISGYFGVVGVDKLVFDFDHLELDKAKSDAIALITKLQNKYNISDESIGIFFSGRKGFAIELKTDKLYGFDKLVSSLYVKKVCTFLAEEFESFDRVIYNVTRLYRIANTQHQKASKVGGIEVKLFKIPLTKKQLNTLSSEDIKKLATRPRFKIDNIPIADVSILNNDLAIIYNNLNSLEVQTLKESTISKPIFIDDNFIPKNYKYCIYKLCQGAYTDSRDNALIRIANYERQQGMPPDVIRAKLVSVLELMNVSNPTKAKLDPITEEDIDRLIRQTINNNYSYGCNDQLLQSLCGQKCYLYKAKENMSKAGTISLLEAYNQSTEFYKHYYENLITTGIPLIDTKMPMFRGTTNLIVGRAGSGKTSLVLNIIKNLAKEEIPTIFFNMDMSLEMLIGRLGSIILADNAGHPVISSKEFMEAHTRQIFNGDFHAAMEKLSKYVYVSSQRHISIQDIKTEIEAQEKIMNRQLKLVIIDHIQLLGSQARSEYEKHTQNAELLTELAKTKNICIIGISHSVNVDSGFGMAAKGSRAWEAETSTQINCFRPLQEFSSEHDRYMSLQFAKNRLGATERIDFNYDGASGWLSELTYEQMLEFDKLKQEMNNRKKEYK